MNGNITRAGLAADLAAMHDIGLGGATIVNVDCGIPAGDAPFMSPAWRDDLKFAVSEAHRQGLELCIENCAGWSSSGGPWVTPEQAMQRVTTSEVSVSGPTTFDQILPQPETKLDYYRDVAVLAFPTPAEGVVSMRAAQAVPTVSGGHDPAERLIDGDETTLVHLPLPQPHHPQYVQLAFPQPFTARSLRLVTGRGMPSCQGQVEVSDDGRQFRSVQSFSRGKRGENSSLISLGDAPVTGRFWRVLFTSVEPKARAKASSLPVAEVSLSDRLVVGNVDAKDGQNGGFVLSQDLPGSADTAAGAIPRDAIVDLTSQLSSDGHLHWSVPAGDWTILRVGYTPTGVHNHPAPASGDGLECDKFTPAALDAHWNSFMQRILDDLGPLGGQTLNCSLIDSYEVGGQNWSGNFRAEFTRRRGYDPVTFLPTFTGRVVGNSALTERFLWDVRRTIADLFADNYYAHFADLCRQHGLKNAVEPYTGPFESLQCGKPADVVMGEFWSGSQGHPSVKLASSVAHIYGKTIVGAESFTASAGPGRWQNDPYSLKTLGDRMFTWGLNRCVFHRYASQPWTNRWPGMTMGPWGFHFERTVTWWNQGKAWINYLTHCQYLLQQGRPIIDVAYFTGESAPVEMRANHPVMPQGYDYDAVNADVLLHGATVQNGRLVLASGMSYAVLVLPPEDYNLTPATLRQLRDLVRAGLTVVGPRPRHSPSLADYPHCDQEVQSLAEEMWGDCDGVNITEHVCGSGRVVWGQELASVFAAQKLGPDFAFQSGSPSANLVYTHRLADGADLYFVSNQRRQFDSADCSFRLTGMAPELWNPEDGSITPAPVWHEEAGRTVVHLDFTPAGSVFVVFRHPSAGVPHLVSTQGDFSPVAGPESNLKILRATYAAADGSGHPLDVTAKVAGLIAGQQPVVVSNDTFGSDPAYLHVKELRVDYTLSGQPASVTVAEEATFDPPGQASTGSTPLYELTSSEDGTATLKASVNGHFVWQTSDGRQHQLEVANVPAAQSVAGPWTLSFPPHWGAPPSVTLDRLISWTESPDNGVKYFSGTATYERDLELPDEPLAAGRELWLDLGAVKNFAEVSLNGTDLGVMWKPPFRVNLTGTARPGHNHLVIKVTNLWPNRLIGDEQLPPDCEWNGQQLKAWPQWLLDGQPSPTGRYTFTTWHHWTKSDQPLESGLLGPVQVETVETAPLR